MSQEQQQSTSFDSDSFSRAETIELLQETARRFQGLVTELKTGRTDYQLPKRSYTNLMAISEKIFNSIAEVSGVSPQNSPENINFDEDLSGKQLTREERIELLQGVADLYQTMADKITSESLDYQLPMSDFETLVPTTEKIVNPFGSAPSPSLETTAPTPVSQGYSQTEFTEEIAVSTNKINWPWLGIVAIILIVISLTAFLSNPQFIEEEIAIEVPPAELEFTSEQKAIAAIEKQIETIATSYDKTGISNIKPNFVADILTLELTEDWQELERDEKEKITNKWLEESRQLEFKKLEIIDDRGVLVARSPVIGKNIVILEH